MAERSPCSEIKAGKNFSGIRLSPTKSSGARSAGDLGRKAGKLRVSGKLLEARKTLGLNNIKVKTTGDVILTASGLKDASVWS